MANDFKEPFERVSNERYEELPQEIEAAVKNAQDLRGDAKAIKACEEMNEVQYPVGERSKLLCMI